MKVQLRHLYQHRYQRGAALVEFALVTSAGFIVVLFAVFELGRLLFIFNTANEATRLGRGWRWFVMPMRRLSPNGCPSFSRS